MNQFRNFAVLFLTLTFFSCNKTNQKATGLGDALIVTQKIGSQKEYAVSLYAYTFNAFKSVTAVSSTDPTKLYTLVPNAGYSTNFYFEPAITDFSITKPAASTFTFSAVFSDGSTQGFQDILSDQVLDLPNLTKCEYNVTTHELEMNWDLLSNADSYAINILDGTTLVFGSTELAKTIKAYAVSSSGGGWTTGFTPVAGKAYTIKLFAFLYEPGGDAYNVQATSVKDTTALWGN